jgi:hypothetical protein
MAWKEQLSESAFWFKRIVWPRVSTCFGCFWGTTLVPNEGIESPPSRLLDSVGGVDYWLLREEPLTMVGLASRVSYGPPAYETFTVGVQELEKRLAAMRGGEVAALPEFTVQASVDRTNLRLLFAWATKTEQLFDYVDSNRNDLAMRANRGSGRPFYVVWLDDYLRNGRQGWVHWSQGTDYALPGGGTWYMDESDEHVQCDSCGRVSSWKQRADYQEEALAEVAALLGQYRPQVDLRELMEGVTKWGYVRSVQRRSDGGRSLPVGALIAHMRAAAMEFMSFSKGPWTATWLGRCHRCGGVVGSENAA